MPTPTMPDEDLDALFRRAAQAYPDDVPPAGAWEGMERQLNTAAATQRLRRKVGRFFAVEVAVLLLLLLLWQGHRYMQRPAEVAAQPAATVPAGARPRAAGSLVATPHRTTPLTSRPPTTRSAATPVVAPRSQAPEAAVLGAALLDPAARAAAARNTATAGRQKLLLGHWAAKTETHPLALLAGRRPAHRPSKPAARLLLASEPAMLTQPHRSPAHQRVASAAGLPLAASTSQQLLELLTYTTPRPLLGAADPLPDSLRRLARPGQAADSTTATANKPRAPRLAYRLVVGLLGAPSFSGVRTAQSAQLGGDYGLTLDYRFTARLRVRGGVISSQKRYRAASADYQAPAAWQWFAGDYTLDANCRVTEIPLDLRYDVLHRPSFSVFSSVGINSLLMRNERYSYDWMMSGQTFTKTAQVIDGSSHLLSVLNVSVGLERALGPRWSAQVEPYWQFPLGGVGAGQVKLSSAGAAFSLKYGLFR